MLNLDKIPFEISPSPLFTESLQPAEFGVNDSRDWSFVTCDPKEIKKPGDTKSITLLSYNVWGAPQDRSSPFFKFNERSTAILDMIKDKEPDIICLQEVSQDWANKILANDYIREHYYCTDKNADRVQSYFGLSQITLSKYPIISATVYGLPGYEISTLLSTTLKIGHQRISVNNVHLHSSKQFTAFRKAQLQAIFNILKEQPDSDIKMIAGDFNFGDGPEWVENTALDPAFKDVWLVLFPDESGYTQDTQINTMRYKVKGAHKQERFDRVLLDSGKALCQAYEMSIVGTRSIEGHEDIWPSDHFGLLTRVKLEDSEPLKSSTMSHCEHSTRMR